MVAVQSGVDPAYTSTHWTEVLENLYDPNLDDVVLQYDEHEICSILGGEGQEQRERDAIAKRREWMAVVSQRREASVEPVYPSVKLAPTTREPMVSPNRLPKPRPSRAHDPSRLPLTPAGGGGAPAAIPGVLGVPSLSGGGAEAELNDARRPSLEELSDDGQRAVGGSGAAVPHQQQQGRRPVVLLAYQRTAAMAQPRSSSRRAAAPPPPRRAPSTTLRPTAPTPSVAAPCFWRAPPRRRIMQQRVAWGEHLTSRPAARAAPGGRVAARHLPRFGGGRRHTAPAIEEVATTPPLPSQQPPPQAAR